MTVSVAETSEDRLFESVGGLSVTVGLCSALIDNERRVADG